MPFMVLCLLKKAANFVPHVSRHVALWNVFAVGIHHSEFGLRIHIIPLSSKPVPPNRFVIVV
jgi:hypothetical protein